MGGRTRHEDEYQQRKAEIMEACYNCYAENGLSGTGIKSLAQACGCTPANLYVYFDNLDDLIIQSTEYCMSKVEDDFMEKAPQCAADVVPFINEIPYWTAEKHGKKYRLMYQVYSHPKYRQYGQRFFAGVNERYTDYARQLEGKIGIPCDLLTGLIFIFVRACVHYALFEDEFYLKAEMNALKHSVELIMRSSEAGQTSSYAHDLSGLRISPMVQDVSASAVDDIRQD